MINIWSKKILKKKPFFHHQKIRIIMKNIKQKHNFLFFLLEDRKERTLPFLWWINLVKIVLKSTEKNNNKKMKILMTNLKWFLYNFSCIKNSTLWKKKSLSLCLCCLNKLLFSCHFENFNWNYKPFFYPI